MPSWQRNFVSGCAGVVAFSVAYMLADYGQWSRLTYFPYQRRWSLESELLTQLPMQYLGTALWGALSGLVVTACVYGVLSRRKRPLGERVLALSGVWAISFFVLAGWYFTWSLWPF